MQIGFAEARAERGRRFVAVCAANTPCERERLLARRQPLDCNQGGNLA